MRIPKLLPEKKFTSVKSILCLLQLTFALGLVSLATPGYAQAFRIDDIRIEGLQRVSPSPVFAAMPLAAGHLADTEAVRNTVRDLFATGFFDDITVLRDGNVLIIRVKERPTISEITIEGNKAIKTEVLKGAMTDNDLDEGQIFQRGMMDGILNELERQYVSQGRYGAEVTGDITELPNNQVAIAITVDEGEVATIKHLNIVGNEAFSHGQLLDLFELKTSGWLSWITSDDRYAREKLRGDIEALESFYLDRGYLDFNVISSQVSLSPDQKSVFITLNIEEGDIYTVSKVELAGELILPEYRMRQLVLLRENSTFSQNLMTTTEEYMAALLGNAGYTNAEVKGIPEKNPEDKTVEITFLVNPSHRMYVRRINFNGNTRTRDEVLRREMRQMEQSSASNSKIQQGKIRLERLGFFKGVEAENRDVPGTSDLIDVDYTVEEQPSGSVNASVGYGQGSGFLFGAGLQENNWLGSGKQVGVSVNHNDWQTIYSFSYNDPYFTPDGVNRGLSLFYNSRDYSRSYVTSYNTDSYGAVMSFGYPISEIQRLNYSLGFTHLEVKTGTYSAQEIRRTPWELDLENQVYLAVSADELGRLQSMNENGLYDDFSLDTVLVNEQMEVKTDPGFVDLYGSKFNTFSAKMSWLRSTLNRGIMANRGSKQTLALELTVPGSDLQYFTIDYDAQIFLPLTEHLTMRLRTSLGYGGGYGDMDRLPFFHNYYAGGFGSVRGFKSRSLGPQASPSANYISQATDYVGVDNDGDGVNDAWSPSGAAYMLCTDDGFQVLNDSLTECVDGELARSFTYSNYRYRAFGGNLLVEFGAELLFPVPFLEDQRSVQMALFLDAGNVFDTECGATQMNCTNFDWNELRSSYGISLNWLSAMGPMTFSLAKPIEYGPEDRRESFQFSMGIPF